MSFMVFQSYNLPEHTIFTDVFYYDIKKNIYMYEIKLQHMATTDIYLQSGVPNLQDLMPDDLK